MNSCNSVKYIRADKAYSQAYKYQFDSPYITLRVLFDDAIPREDVKPVVHAHWIESPISYREDGRQMCRCSNCRLMSPRPIGSYCRYCGAQMDEEPTWEDDAYNDGVGK